MDDRVRRAAYCTSVCVCVWAKDILSGFMCVCVCVCVLDLDPGVQLRAGGHTHAEMLQLLVIILVGKQKLLFSSVLPLCVTAAEDTTPQLSDAAP